MPLRKTVSSRAPVPGFGLEADQLVLSIPDGRPLHTIQEPIVGESGEHRAHRIGEGVGGINGPVQPI